MTTPFNLIEVTVGGENVQARPIEYSPGEHDGTGLLDNGEYIVPTKFMTTCPVCVQLLEFTPTQMFLLVGGKKVYVDCPCSPPAKGNRITDTGQMLFTLRSIDLHIHSIIAESWKVTQDSPARQTQQVVETVAAAVALFADPVEAGLAQFAGLVRLDV
jgi:hypothetical protein